MKILCMVGCRCCNEGMRAAYDLILCVLQMAAANQQEQLAIKTAVPLGAAALIGTFVLIAALTGCFGAKAAAVKAAAASAAKAAAAGKKATASGASGPIPISVTASAGR